VPTRIKFRRFAGSSALTNTAAKKDNADSGWLRRGIFASSPESGSRPGEKRRRIEGATNRLVTGPRSRTRDSNPWGLCNRFNAAVSGVRLIQPHAKARARRMPRVRSAGLDWWARKEIILVLHPRRLAARRQACGKRTLNTTGQSPALFFSGRSKLPALCRARRKDDSVGIQFEK